MSALDPIFDNWTKKISDLRQMAHDPIAVAIMREIVAQLDGKAPLTPRPAQGQQAKPNYTPNGLMGVVAEHVNGYPEDRFTIGHLVNYMQDGGYQFAAKEPKVAVYSALKILAGKGLIHVAEKGQGNNPTVYAKGKSAS